MKNLNYTDKDLQMMIDMGRMLNKKSTREQLIQDLVDSLSVRKSESFKSELQSHLEKIIK